MTATNLIVIGPSGIGKSTLLARVAERLAGRTIRGFNSASMWEGERRIGWRLDACDGSDGGVFAHRDMISETRMGPYGTDMALYERIVLAQLVPIDTDAIYFIDEIGFGPESSLPAYESQVALLDSPARVIAIARYRDDGRTPFAEAVKRRPDAELIEVSLENREVLVDEIAGRFPR